MRAPLAALLVSALINLPAFAQASSGGQIEEIIVTGSRVTDWDFYDIPAVTLTLRADYMVQPVKVINDSRSEDLRIEELYATIEALLLAAANTDSFSLGIGDDIFVPLTRENLRLPLASDSEKSDTSYTEFLIKAPLRQGVNATAIEQEIREFIRTAPVVGRTELYKTDDVGLTIVNPDQYRDNLITKVAEDVQKTIAAFGLNYSAQIEGLASPLMWQRKGPDTMTLFIDYAFTIVPADD